MKIKRNIHILSFLLFLIKVSSSYVYCQSTPDSIKIETDTIIDSIIIGKNLIFNKDIKHTVKYFAKDSCIMDAPKKMAYLYGNAKVTYGDMNLEANYIEIDYNKNEIVARGLPNDDSIITGLPIFKQGDDVFTSNEMRYNFKTGKGIIKNVVTQEGEGFIHGNRVKMNDEKNLFIRDAQYTTCNLEHPHFAIKSRKLKVVPEKHVVSGPFFLAINNVPMPLGFLFGIFPIPKDRASGIIIPTYGETQQRGFFLRNGGFYWATNEYIGIHLVGDIYTNGSWRGNILTNYKKRYKYGGNMEMRLAKIHDGFDKDTAEYKSFLDGKEYWFKWSHNPVQSGNSRFSASVNLGSTNYQRNNSYAVQTFLNQNFNSTITYYKKFGNSPFSLNASLRQDQNQNGTMNFTLPDISFNMVRQYPFKWMKGKSSAWYKKISVGYSLSLKNKITNQLSPFSSTYNVVNDRPKQIKTTINFFNLDSLKYLSNYGFIQNIPINTTIKAFKYFTINPDFQFTEYWYPKSYNFNDFDVNNNGVVVDTISKFSRAYSYNFRTNVNTTMYGLFFLKIGNLEAIRHTMRPTIGYNYKPDFGDVEKFNFYQLVQNQHDTIEKNTQLISRYEGSIIGSPSRGEQQTVSLSLSNNFEMKIKEKNDTIVEYRKVTLFDNVSLSTSYNFVADSLNLAPLALNARTKIFGININFNSNYDFYQLDSLENGTTFRVNKYIWEGESKKFARLTQASLNLSTNLNPAKNNKVEMKPKNETERLLLEDINAHPEDYVDFNIPWSLNVSYNLQWVKNGFKEPQITQSLQFNGDVSLTPNWKIGVNSGFDLQKNDLTPTNFSIYRNMHCWEMRFTWIPFGVRTSYTFDINVKASVLQDLKLSKRDDWRNN